MKHHEPRHIVLQTPSPSTPLLELLELLECLAVPLAFALLFLGGPAVTPMQPPWWVIVGLVWYGALTAWGLEVPGRL